MSPFKAAQCALYNVHCTERNVQENIKKKGKCVNFFNETGFGGLFIYQLETQTVHLKVPPPPKLNTMSPFKVAQCTVQCAMDTLKLAHKSSLK